MPMSRQALRQRRRQQGFTQESIAFALGVSTTTYRDWERGIAMPRVGFRPRIARELEVSLAEVDRLLTDDGRPAIPRGLAVPAWLGHFAALEQGASELWSYEPVVVPGLLQTADYTAALQHGDPRQLDEADIARRVEARVARQKVLDREPDPLRLSVVLDESVLHRVAGDRAVMAGQLARLVEAATRPTISLRVVPLDSGVFSAAWGSFTILTSTDSMRSRNTLPFSSICPAWRCPPPIRSISSAPTNRSATHDRCPTGVAHVVVQQRQRNVRRDGPTA